LHTRSATVAPDPAMPTPRWKQFLADTFGGDTDMTAFVQRLAGYSASADTGIHVLPFLHGAGQNGKSVLMDVLRQVLGDYADTAPAGFLMAGKQEHSEEMARLQGLRLVVASEVNQDAKFDEAKMKELTGGDTITARYMRQSFFSFEPTHHLWLMGNHQPQVKAGGDSFWRRLRLVPFLHKVAEDKKIENLADILVAEEGPGILAWIIRGAIDCFDGGLRAPDAVMDATKVYAEEEDQLGRFLDECCLIGGGEHVKLETKKLRAAYEAWCHAEGEKPLSSSPFGREMKQRGIVKKPSNGKHFYPNLALIALESDDDRWGE
ncbi:DNA primase family protein, partial [Streptomyces luteocolor]|uniref:DNA primase family protein n=1 Tax=Streptomyces luteocolor TaxID=285500 RepID=UPI001EDC2F55